MAKWSNIQEPVMRGVGNAIWHIWGTVGFSMDYNSSKKEIELIIYNKPYKFSDKKEIINKKYIYNVGSNTCAVVDIVKMIEKDLYIFFDNTNLLI